MENNTKIYNFHFLSVISNLVDDLSNEDNIISVAINNYLNEVIRIEVKKIVDEINLRKFNQIIRAISEDELNYKKILDCILNNIDLNLGDEFFEYDHYYFDLFDLIDKDNFDTTNFINNYGNEIFKNPFILKYLYIKHIAKQICKNYDQNDRGLLIVINSLLLSNKNFNSDNVIPVNSNLFLMVMRLLEIEDKLNARMKIDEES